MSYDRHADVHVRTVCYTVQKTCNGDEIFSLPALDALWELRNHSRGLRRGVSGPTGVGGLTGTYFASNGCRIDWVASQVGEVDLPDLPAPPPAPRDEPSAIAAARAWLDERGVAGNQSDQRACSLMRNLLDHLAQCALFDKPVELEPIESPMPTATPPEVPVPLVEDDAP